MTLLYQGLEHLWVLVSAGVPRIKLLWIQKDDCNIDSLTLDSQPTALQVMPQQILSLLSPPYFLQKAHYGFLACRNLKHHFNNTLGGHFKLWIHQHKYKSVKNVALYKPSKGHQSHMRAEAEGGESIIYSNLSWNVCIGWLKFLTALHICEWPGRHYEYWFWGYK